MWRVRHDAQPQCPAIGRGDSPLPLGSRKGVSYLDGEDVRCQQLMHAVAEVVPDPGRLVRVDFREDPLEARGRVEDTSLAIPHLADGGHTDIENAVFLPDLFPDTVRTPPDPAGDLGIEELPGDDVIDDGLRISQ
jgi:hypothetical protein